MTAPDVITWDESEERVIVRVATGDLLAGLRAAAPRIPKGWRVYRWHAHDGRLEVEARPAGAGAKGSEADYARAETAIVDEARVGGRG